MPLDEYRCGDCHAVSTLLGRSWTSGARPARKRCGGPSVTRPFSGFAFHRSWGNSFS